MAFEDHNRPGQARKLRFGSFEVDLRSRELRNRGLRVKLEQKPFQILQLLLEDPGALVTRMQLARHLWPDLHVNFDRSLNTAMNTLRQVLGDSSRHCRYIETQPGAGYRFIAHVEEIEPKAALAEQNHSGKSLRRVDPTNFEAYQDYLKGRYFCNKMTEADLHKSVAYFEAALAQDPRCALAYAGLADTYNLFASLGLLPVAEAHRRAKEFALIAVRIDSELAEAHTSLASAIKLFVWDWAGAEAEYRKALQLDPNYAAAHYWYADFLSALGRPREALREIRCALELDPLSLVINMEVAWNLHMARDFQGALDQSWKTLVLEPKFAPAQHTLGLTYEQLGMHEEAITELQNACTCSGDHPACLAALGHAYASAGQTSAASETLRRLNELSQRRSVSPYWRSILYEGLRAEDLAFGALEEACRERDVWLVWLGVEPRFDRLRGDTRFASLLRKIGLEP